LPKWTTTQFGVLLGQWLSERLGQPFVIENRPGGGANIATEAVVRASPDGYTLLITGGYNTINATLYDKLNFNFIRDIAAVAGIVVYPDIMFTDVPSPPSALICSDGERRARRIAQAGRGRLERVACQEPRHPS